MESKTHAWTLIHGKREYAGMHIDTWKARRPMHMLHEKQEYMHIYRFSVCLGFISWLVGERRHYQP